RIAEGLERTIGTLDGELEKLGRKELNTPIHGQLLLLRGRALRNLALISSNKEELLGYAIGSETEAVNIFNRYRSETGSARAHYELALSYMDLAEVRDRERNIDIAIRSLDEAKEIINYDDDQLLFIKIEEKLKFAWKDY
ncbi:MAG: hypothetical protein JW939_08975, partial [Candidatus Thermoplasmatota archaeon]|nr:hypothetical protein [Candidatus Thermoplasmatota archaeon]